MSSIVQTNSNTKSTKNTAKFGNSPFGIKEESSMISLNIQDLRTLMKKKEKEYQNQLQIQDAKRVHAFLVDIEQQKKIKAREKIKQERNKAKMAITRYNENALAQFQEEWKVNLQKTLNNLQQIGSLAEQQHKKQLQQAKLRLQQAKNGKSLQNIKFSKQILQLQDQLKKLVKTQRYEQATIVQKMLQSKKKQFMKKSLDTAIQKQTKALQHLKKQQLKEKKLLSDKLNKIYIDQQQKQAKQIEVMMKNMRTYQIDIGKVDSRVSRISRTLQSTKRQRNKSTNNFESINLCSNKKPSQQKIKNNDQQLPQE